MKFELVYLGFVVSKDGLKMDTEKVQEIVDWPSPRSIFEVRSFHGLASFHRKIIKHFSGICGLIIETIKKDKFQLVTKRITEQPILRLPDFGKPFQVTCDASGLAIGAVLSQEDKPAAYFSEKINDAKIEICLK